MMNKWVVKKIKDIAHVTAGQSPEGKYYNEIGEGLPFYQGKKEFTEKYIGEPKVWTSFVTKEALEGDVLMSVRAPVGPVNFATQKCCIGRGLASIRVKEKFDKDFLFLFFKNIENKLTGNTGAVFNSINKSQIENIEIPIPPLEEQQTIVSKLDQAFAAIDQAKANIEKNIANAKELFQSKLNQIFSQKGEGWEEKTLEKTFKLKSGDGLTSKMMIPDGEYPVYGGNNVAGYFNKFNFEHGVIVGRVGALCGNARYINEKVWITDNAFKLTEFKYDFDFKFLSYLLNFKNLRSYARQAAQPVISNSSLKDVILNFPNSIETQQQIVSQLEQLQEQTNLLVSKYEQKLANLEELKKSILEKAFKGELV